MRVILLETDKRYFADIALGLTPVLGKPLLERAIEYWVDFGATSFEIVLEQSPHEVEAVLGNGAKWGVQLRYHLTDPTDIPDEEQVVLGRLSDFPPPAGLTQENCYTVSSANDWSGWAYGCFSQMASIQNGKGESVAVYHPSRAVDTQEAFQSLQLFLLRRGCVEARQERPGVWMAPGAKVHPAAVLYPPVYLGPDSVVGARTTLGPAVVLGSQSLVGADCRLVDSWVKPGTFVSAGKVAVNRVVGSSRPQGPTIVGRLLALLLLSFLWPLLLLKSKIPAALLRVVMGQLALLGRCPRTPEEMKQVPSDWVTTMTAVPQGALGCHKSLEDDFFFCALPEGWPRVRHFLTSLR